MLYYSGKSVAVGFGFVAEKLEVEEKSALEKLDLLFFFFFFFLKMKLVICACVVCVVCWSGWGYESYQL